MPITNKLSIKTKTIFAILSLAAAAMILIMGLFSPAVQASSLASVTSNIADVPGGASLILTIQAQNDGDIHELEVDHSLSSTLPEFSVYANAANPYGGTDCGTGNDEDCQTNFSNIGVNVTYSAANSEWVIDFGDTVTDIIRDNGGEITFYFVLKDAANNDIWGSMSPTTAENTFRFDLLAGTGDSLAFEQVDEATDAIIPRVPNTSIVR